MKDIVLASSAILFLALGLCTQSLGLAFLGIGLALYVHAKN